MLSKSDDKPLAITRTNGTAVGKLLQKAGCMMKTCSLLYDHEELRAPCTHAVSTLLLTVS